MSIQVESNRRKFIESLGLLSLGLPLSTSIHASTLLRPEQPETENAFATLPFLENLTSTSCCISIITKSKSLTWIEYGEERPKQKVFREEHGFKQANTTLFKIPLINLKPETTYTYRFVSKPIIAFNPNSATYGEEQHTAVFTFTTPPIHMDRCRAVVFNDLHDRGKSLPSLWKQIPKGQIDFVAFNGDIFNHIRHEEQLVDNFFSPIGNLFSTHIPLLLLRGNHETRGKYAREFIHYFDLPNGKTYHSFRKGSIFWICLDTGEDKEDTHREYSGMVSFDRLRIEQRDWLEEVVQSKDFKEASFRVVLMHIPPIHSGNWHGTTHCGKLFTPIFNKHHIHAVISGHTHRHAFHPPSDRNKFALFIGNGPKEGERTLIDVKADKKQLEVRVIHESGKELYHWEIKK